MCEELLKVHCNLLNIKINIQLMCEELLKVHCILLNIKINIFCKLYAFWLKMN